MKQNNEESFESSLISEKHESEISLDDNKILSLKLSGDNHHIEVIENSESNKINFSRILKILGYFLIGIACFAPYNSMLSGLNCFIVFHKAYKPEFVYSNLYFFSNFFVQFIVILIPPDFSYYNAIQISQTLSIITMILNPIALRSLSYFSSFVATCVIVVIQGSSSAILFTCLYSFLAYLEKVYITSVVTGHGMSGILMNLSSLITTLYYDSKPNSENMTEDNLLQSLFIFYYIGAGIIFINILIWIYLKNQIDIKRALKIIHPSDVMFDEEVNHEERCLSLYSLKSYTDNNTSLNKFQSDYSEFKKVKEVLNHHFRVNLTLFIHGLVSFAIYPGIIIKNKTFFENGNISILFNLILFNVFDILGRKLPILFSFSKINNIICLVIFRIYFVFYFTMIQFVTNYDLHTFKFMCNIYSIISHIALFAFTNGFAISNSFTILGEDKNIKENLKSKSSAVLSVSLNLGIYCGTTLAYLLNYLITFNTLNCK